MTDMKIEEFKKISTLHTLYHITLKNQDSVRLNSCKCDIVELYDAKI